MIRSLLGLSLMVCVARCADECSKEFFPDPADKHAFYMCKKVHGVCPDGNNFDPTAKACVPTGTTQPSPSTTTSSVECTKEKELFPDPADKHAFFVCKNGKKVHMVCPDGNNFDPTTKSCVEPGTTQVPPTTTTSAVECKEKQLFPDPTDKHAFFVCKNGKKLHIVCPDNGNFDPATLACS